jgi:hypothetical protein
MTSMLQGHLDTCNEMGSSGWAWCPSNPAATVEIVYQIDESTPNFVPAQEFRTDLRAAGIGDGAGRKPKGVLFVARTFDYRGF